MAIWQFDLTMKPPVRAQVDRICDELSSNFQELDSWSQGLRVWGQKDSHRVECFSDAEGTLFRVRLDLREPVGKFVNKIITIVERFDMTIEDEQGKPVNPSVEGLIEPIKSSDAFRFVADPMRFFDGLTTS
jgi:hypothetical protein